MDEEDLLYEAVREENPLHRAVRRGDLAEVTRLVALPETDIDATDPYNGTALCCAVLYTHTDIVKILIESGASVNLSSPMFQNTPLHMAVSVYREPATARVMEIARVLVDAGVDINALTRFGITALHMAIQNIYDNDMTMVSFLLAAGADVNYPPYGMRLLPTGHGFMTALHFASFMEPKSEYLLPLLLSAGADIYIRDDHMMTPRIFARYYDNKKAETLLCVWERTQPLLQLCTVFVCEHQHEFPVSRLRLLPRDILDKLKVHLEKMRRAIPRHLKELLYE